MFTEVQDNEDMPVDESEQEQYGGDGSQEQSQANVQGPDTVQATEA